MDTFTGYLFPVVWGLIAIYLVYAGKKVNKFCYYLSLLFFYLCGWYLADQLIPEINLFEGTAGIIFKIVVCAFLLAGAVIYFTKIREKNNNGEE